MSETRVHDVEAAGEELLAILERAAACHAAGTALPQDVQRRFASASFAYLEAAGGRSFDDALGLKTQRSGRSLARRAALARRQVALAQAFSAIDDRLSNWRRCEILAVEIKDFETRLWPACSAQGLPANSSALRTALFDLFRLYALTNELPAQSTRAIWSALKPIIDLT